MINVKQKNNLKKEKNLMKLVNVINVLMMKKMEFIQRKLMVLKLAE